MTDHPCHHMCHVCRQPVGTWENYYTVFALARDEKELSVAPPASGEEHVIRGVCGPCLDKLPRRHKSRPSKRGRCHDCGADARGELGKPFYWDRIEEDESYSMITSTKDPWIKRRLCNQCAADYIAEYGDENGEVPLP